MGPREVGGWSECGIKEGIVVYLESMSFFYIDSAEGRVVGGCPSEVVRCKQSGTCCRERSSESPQACYALKDFDGVSSKDRFIGS